MANLTNWLQRHNTDLIRVAVEELSPSTAFQETMQPTVASFYGALSYSAESNSYTLLHAVLINWARFRLAFDTGGSADTPGLFSIVLTLKRAVWRTIENDALSPAETLELIRAFEPIFDEANQYAAKLEDEGRQNDTQRRIDDVRDEVHKLDKSKSDFIAVAAHELKTPLTLIEGYLNMLRAEFKEEEAPRAALMVSGINSGTGRLREIVEDMIDVSLIDLRLLNLHYQPVWLHRLVDMVSFDLAEAMRQRNLQLVINRTELPDRPTYADAERLYQAVHKIVSNAIKFTPDGGTITIRGRELPGFTDLQISDTGIGIAPENLGRIFEKFSSMGNTALHSSGKVKFKGGGPGLGLAIAKGFLEAHNGSIWAESSGFDERALPGSTFHIMIPMRLAPPGDQMEVLFNAKHNSDAPQAQRA